MEKVNVFKDLETTFGECEAAMKSLGYPKNRKEDFIQWENKAHSSLVRTPAHLDSEDIILYLDVLATADLLEWQGVIPNQADYANFILKSRHAAQMSAAA